MGAGESKQLPPGFKDIAEFDKGELKEYQNAFDNGGLSALKKKIEKNKDKLKNVPVNIAVTGEIGVGKSSFINSFRGLKAGQVGAADVGVDETTKEPTKYLHPKNNNILLWDLPGVGTPKFPRATYLQMVEFQKYDYFLILTAGRFRENDLWLANEVRKLGKQFFFVRTKMDIDVQNDKLDNPLVCKDETVNKVRKSIATNVKSGGFEGVEVFLIDNRSLKEYDYPLLQEAMIKNVPKMKQDAMTFSLTNLTEDLIYRKRDALRERIMKVSFFSALGGAIPIPDLSLVVDTRIIMQECQFYKAQLGLDDETLQENADMLLLSEEELKAKIKMKSHFLGTSVSSTLAFVETLAVSEDAVTMIILALPIIGNAIAASMSYGSTVSVLRSILDVFVTDALAINKLSVERLSTKAESLFPCFFSECFFILI